MKTLRHRHSRWVDPNCPIDWNHPLNFGLVSWWLALPQGMWTGGKTFRDLNRSRQSEGTLTNFSFPNTTTSGWQGPQGRPGGYGCLAFDGTDDYADAGASASLDPLSSNWSAFCWLRSSTTGTRRTAAQKYVFSGGASPEAGWYIDMLASGAARCIVESDTTHAVFSDSTTLIDNGAWHHVGFAFAGGVALRVYVDGNDVTANTISGGGPGSVSTTNPCRIGYPSGSFSNYWAGSLDDVRVCNRALTAAQVAALYAESRAGYPNALRWLSTRAYSPPPAGFVTGPLRRERNRSLVRR